MEENLTGENVTVERQPPTGDEKNLAVVAHLLGLTLFLGPLIMWLVHREKGGFVEEQTREALNFGITSTIALAISSLFCCIAYYIAFGVWIGVIVFCIVAALKVSKGEPYRYPLCLRLIS